MTEFTGYETVVLTIGVFGAAFVLAYWLLDRLFGEKRCAPIELLDTEIPLIVGNVFLDGEKR